MRGAPVVVVAAAIFAGCGEKTIVPDATEDTIVDFVKQNTGADARDVECPEGVEAKAGTTFECTFQGPEGPYVAKMTVQSVDGNDVQYGIVTERAP